jgi:hypothetical protein
MTTLWMSPKKRVENESQRTGHDLIPERKRLSGSGSRGET